MNTIEEMKEEIEYNARLFLAEMIHYRQANLHKYGFRRVSEQFQNLRGLFDLLDSTLKLEEQKR